MKEQNHENRGIEHPKQEGGQEKEDKIIEFSFPYGPATVIERTPESEIGDDYEILEDLIFVTPDGKKISAYDIADIEGLRIGIETNDASGDRSVAQHHELMKMITIPREATIPKEYDELGVPIDEKEEKAELWSFPGCWLTLLHEIGHARIMDEDPERIERDAKYRVRLEMFQGSMAEGEFVGVAAAKPYIDRILQQERDAWAYALRTLRKLRDEGIDLEPEMDNKKIENYLHAKMATYVLEMMMFSAEGDDEAIENYVSGLNKTLKGEASNLMRNNEVIQRMSEDEDF